MSLNDFVVLGKLGEGAYSSVQKVKRLSDGQIYALKKVKIGTLKDKEKQNALNEVRLLASVNSEHVIKYRESFFDSRSNTLCIVIEYAEGGDLEKVIEGKKREMAWVSEREAWKMARQVLTGLCVLHQRSIIHPDLKSANIFMAGGNYKVADLNVSKLLKADLALTQTGTPYYASPEVWKDKPYELKSDIWSFGCIIYELCALKPPFTANSMEGLFKKVQKGVYPKIPAVYSSKISRLIDMCLQLDPKKRATTRELLNFVEDQDNQPEKDLKRSSRISSVNLLNTIKLPKNLDSWKQELPKADYETLSEKGSAQNFVHPKYGQVSQNRLREIVRIKNQETLGRKKPEDAKKQEENVPASRESVGRRLAAIEHLSSGRSQTKIAAEKANPQRPRGASNKEGLPRIEKMHSQPGNADPHDRVNQLLSRLREEERRRYEHNRPSWWG